MRKGPQHKEIGKYLKDAVYGANDGIITTFAVVAGVAGADLPTATILLLGTANLAADGFAMAASSWLSTRSEKEVYERERSVEEWELQHQKEDELSEMQTLLKERGYSAQDAILLSSLLFKNKELWLDVMMEEELKLSSAQALAPLRGAFTTFTAFVFAGVIPLLAYFFLPSNNPNIFLFASVLTAVALFGVGVLRSFFIKRSRWFAGLEMLLVGGIAAIIAYTLGAFVKALIG
jgi:VIT1/CCC1 family predicted Fe2+/Mn2+ transporter